MLLSTLPLTKQSIFNEDANQWLWTAEVGVEMEVLGPFDSVAVRIYLKRNGRDAVYTVRE